MNKPQELLGHILIADFYDEIICFTSWKNNVHVLAALFKEDETNVKGPLPPEGLFEDVTFLITYVDRSDEEKAYDKYLRRRSSQSDVTSDDGNEEGSGACSTCF